MNAELTDLPVHALSAGLADKRFTARDIVDACLTRIDALEPKLAAFVAVYGPAWPPRPPTRRASPSIAWVRYTAFRLR